MMSEVAKSAQVVQCDVYRAAKHDEMYIYLRSGLELDVLPQALREHTGRLDAVMALDLTPDRKLARADVEKVMAELLERGFYLQLPPHPVKNHFDA